MTHQTQEISPYGNTNKGTIGLENNKQRCRSWFLTINSFDQSHVEFLKNLSQKNVKFVVFQSECGTKSKIDHLHAIVQYANQRTFASVKKIWPMAHIEQVKNLQKCTEYCTKQKTWTGIRYMRRGANVLININEFRNPKCTDIVEVHMCTCGKYSAEELKIGSQKWIKHFILEGPINIAFNSFLNEKLDKKLAKIGSC